MVSRLFQHYSHKLHKIGTFELQYMENSKCLLLCRGFVLKIPLLAENGLFAYIFKTGYQSLMIFSQMLDSIALNDFASVLCSKIVKNKKALEIPFPPNDSDFLKVVIFC